MDTDSELDSSSDSVVDLEDWMERESTKYEIELSDSEESLKDNFAASEDVKTWHNRLDHVGTLQDIKNMLDEGLLPKPQVYKIDCDPCAKGKYRKRYSGV